MNNTQSIQSNLLQQRINEAIDKKVASTLTGSDFFERQKEGFMGFGVLRRVPYSVPALS